MTGKKRGKKLKAISLIVNLVVAIIAFSFIIGLAEVEVVSGVERELRDFEKLGKPAKDYQKYTIGISGGKNYITDGQNFILLESEKGRQLLAESLKESGAGPSSTPGRTWLENLLGYKTPSTSFQMGWNNILAGVQHAGTAYIAVKMIGSMLGLEKPTVDALSRRGKARVQSSVISILYLCLGSAGNQPYL